MAARSKGGQPVKSFAGIPRIVIDSVDYKKLSGNSVKLLLALSYQYRGNNNGDLTAAFSVMQEKFGFTARGVVERAVKQLIDCNLIIQTRTSRFLNPGGQCALYALTWLSIDECKGRRLEVNPTITPPRKFSIENGKTPCTESVHGSVPNQYTVTAKNA